MDHETRAQCPSCGSSIPFGAHYCPTCGTVMADVPDPAGAMPQPPVTTVYVQQPPVPTEGGWGAWGAVIVVSILVLGAAGLMLWTYGYAGTAASNPATPTNITVENSPQTSTSAEPDVLPPATPPPAEPPAASEPPPAPAIPSPEIVSVQAKATSMEPLQWTYSYTLKLRNTADTAVWTGVQVKFLDKDGYVLDDDLLENLYLAPNSEQVFEDFDLIKPELAMRVATVKAVLR